MHLKHEDLADVCELLRVYLEHLPEPLIEEGVRAAFFELCLHSSHKADSSRLECPTPSAVSLTSKSHRSASLVLLRLLPRENLSLLTYLLTFLMQLLEDRHDLDLMQITSIFGDAMFGLRSGPSEGSEHLLGWFLINWSELCEEVFEIPTHTWSQENINTAVRQNEVAEWRRSAAESSASSGEQSDMSPPDSPMPPTEATASEDNVSIRSASSGRSIQAELEEHR